MDSFGQMRLLGGGGRVAPTSPGGSASAPLLEGDMADDAADGILLEGDESGYLLFEGDEA